MINDCHGYLFPARMLNAFSKSLSLLPRIQEDQDVIGASITYRLAFGPNSGRKHKAHGPLGQAHGRSEDVGQLQNEPGHDQVSNGYPKDITPL